MSRMKKRKGGGEGGKKAREVEEEKRRSSRGRRRRREGGAGGGAMGRTRRKTGKGEVEEERGRTVACEEQVEVGADSEGGAC